MLPCFARTRIESEIREYSAAHACTVSVVDECDIGGEEIEKFACLPVACLVFVELSPEEGIYAGKRFVFVVVVYKEYPFVSPKVYCLTDIFHPNIDDSGIVCLSILRHNWMCTYGLHMITCALYMLFSEVSAEDALNDAVRKTMVEDIAKFEDTARNTADTVRRSYAALHRKIQHILQKKDRHMEQKYEKRNLLYERAKQKYERALLERERKPLKMRYRGKEVAAVAFETKPYEISKVHNENHKDTIVCRINGKLFDFWRPIEEEGDIQFFDFSSPEGKEVFWHSSAHLLGLVVEKEPGVVLTKGPATSTGFYYEIDTKEPITQEQGEKLVRLLEQEKKYKFEFAVATKEELLEMFSYNTHKCNYIRAGVPDGGESSVYKVGDFVDFCRGPHISSTSLIKRIRLVAVGSSQIGKDETFQRVACISFPSDKHEKEYQYFLEQARQRDHRRIGTQQELIYFSKYSPGSAFFQPDGCFIYNKLVEYVRGEYRFYGFKEVITPNIFAVDLWKTSGHYLHYKECMFIFDTQGEEHGLKPMNCPGHCLLFGSRMRSHNELPLRFADFGILHRNEASGALTGLTRVRRFSQDDAHIFCKKEDIESEMISCLRFLKQVYSIFGFKFEVFFSTRPEKYMGDLCLWEESEATMKSVIEKVFSHRWTENAGDGAFYGPKIDIMIKDAMNRTHQCGTIQLDFQLPIKFGLSYQAKDGTLKTPVIIHRAIFGSLERFFAILCEHFSGKWPFWINPKQIIVIPVSPEFDKEAERLSRFYFQAGFESEADCGSDLLKKKILNAEKAHVSFIIVIGKKETEKKEYTVRVCGHKNTYMKCTEEETVRLFAYLKEKRKLCDPEHLKTLFAAADGPEDRSFSKLCI